MVRWLREGARGAVNVSNKMCEGCQLKRPTYGLPAERKKRWCGVCAKGRVGVVNVTNKRLKKKKKKNGVSAPPRRRSIGGQSSY